MKNTTPIFFEQKYDILSIYIRTQICDCIVSRCTSSFERRFYYANLPKETLNNSKEKIKFSHRGKNHSDHAVHTA